MPIDSELAELVELTRKFNLHVPPPYFASESRLTRYENALAPVVAPAGDEPMMVYLGVPLCDEHCNFCMYFYGFADGAGRKAQDCVIGLTDFLAALRDVPRRVAAGIYIGGGTPSVLSADQIDELLAAVNATFTFERTAQCTFEMSPLSLTRAKLDAVVGQGLKRVSFGIQSFDPEPVRLAGRGFHTPDAVAKMLRDAAAAGITDVNVDVMVGLTGESDTSLSESVRHLWDIGCPTVSIYRYRPMRQRELAARDGTDAYVDTCQRRVELAVEMAHKVGYHATGRADGEHIRLTRIRESPWPERNIYDTRYRPSMRNSLAAIGSGGRSFLRDTQLIHCAHRPSAGFTLLGREVEVETCTDHDRVAAALVNEMFRTFEVDIAAVSKSTGVAVDEVCGAEVDFLTSRGIVRLSGDVLAVVPEHHTDWMYWDKVFYPPDWLSRRRGVATLRVR